MTSMRWVLLLTTDVATSIRTGPLHQQRPFLSSLRMSVRTSRNSGASSDLMRSASLSFKSNDPDSESEGDFSDPGEIDDTGDRGDFRGPCETDETEYEL